MKTLVKRTIGLLMAMLVAFGVTAGSTQAFAEGSDTVTSDNGLTSLAQLDASGQPTIAQPSKVINDTYWSDLEKISVTNSQNKTYYGVLPKYVLKPGQTALSKLGIYAGGNGSVDAFPSTGISETEYGIRILDYMAFYRFGYLVGEDTYAPPFKDRPSTDAIPDRVNPYNFTADELLTQDEIKDPMKLTVYADIKKKDSKDSKLVDEYKPGDALPLDFTVNASWFKRYIMGFTLDQTRTGYMGDEEIKQEHDSYGTFDSQIVYTLDIPEGVDVNNPSATLSGLDGFDVTTEVKNENGKKILIVSLRLKEDKRGKTAKWADTIEKLRKLDTSNIKISVAGLSVSCTATQDKVISLRGTASGFFEWATARGIDLSSNNKNAVHVHLYFAAKQSEAGRDSAADKTKPNLISYSFKVKKADAKEDQDREPRVLYRLYNPYTHEHFFTAETVENDNLVRLGWKSEGGVGYIYKHAEKGGVYRLYNPTTGEHHYTMNEDEVAACVKAGWKNEGVKWFSAQDKEVTLNKLYSMYNPYEKKFYHHYTADAKEIEQMVKDGWRKEEVKWCTLPLTYIIKK